MSREIKINTTIRIKESLHMFIKDNRLNLSQEINEALTDRYTKIPELDKKIVEHLAKVEWYEKQREKIIQLNKGREIEIATNLSEEQKDMLEESRTIIQRNPNYLIGRYKYYKNTFDSSINLEDFKTLLHKKSV